MSAAHFISARLGSAYTKKVLLQVTGLLLTALVGSQVQAATQHVVSAGDTLSGIAVRYNVSQIALTDANNLQVTDIQIGQTLNIPDNNKPHNLYKVEAGDSLSSISKKYNIALNDLAAVNKISPQAGLYIDSILIIPITGQSTAKQATATASAQSKPTKPAVTVASNDKNATRHRITYGDTLSKIARTYKVTLNDLAKANNMMLSDTLYFGRELIIPTADGKPVASSSSSKNTPKTPKTVLNSNKYVVRSGDTLTGVANQFNISLTDIATLNNIEQYNLLTIGQVLTLPTHASPSQNWCRCP